MSKTRVPQWRPRRSFDRELCSQAQSNAGSDREREILDGVYFFAIKPPTTTRHDKVPHVFDILTDLKDGDSLLCRKQEIYFRSLRWVPAAGRRFSCEKVDSLELCSLERAPHRL